MPFWNVRAADLWTAARPRINSAFDAMQKAAPARKSATTAAYDSAVKAYADALDTELSLVQQAANPIVEAQVAIQSHIAAHPEVFSSRAEVASSDRVRAMFAALGEGGMWWERAIYHHLADLRTRTQVEAPFEKAEDKLMPLN